MPKSKAEVLALIERNIAAHGQHLYSVSGGASPRFSYSIGLTQSYVGTELVLAGALMYRSQEVPRILNGIAEQLRAGADPASGFSIGDLGSFSLGPVRAAWVSELLLGAVDYYRGREVQAYQVIPDEEHRTLDVPDLAEPPSARANRPWRWLREDWPFAVPKASNAATNLAALRGERVTEAARWEDDYWEIFAESGPDAEPCLVPLGVLVAADETLRDVMELDVGAALRRDAADGPWIAWDRTSDETETS